MILLMTSLYFRFVISQSQTKTWAVDSYTASSATAVLAACLQSMVDPADITQGILSSAPVICTAVNEYGTLLLLLHYLYWRRFSWGKWASLKCSRKHFFLCFKYDLIDKSYGRCNFHGGKNIQSNCINCWDFIASVVDDCNKSLEQWWNDMNRETYILNKKTCPIATLLTINHAWNCLRLYLGLCGEESATNCLSNGTMRKIVVFRFMRACSLVGDYQCPNRTCCLHCLRGDVTECFSKTVITICETVML